jgi:ferritin-like metal-binding protein YciE
MKINTFEELLVHEMQDLYDAEQHIAKALPKMVSAASSPQLRSAFEKHLEQTKAQIGRLEQAFQGVAQTPKAGSCKGVKGLIDEGSALIDEKADPAVKDAGLIVAAQKIEHYEIAAYGSVRAWANRLGHERIAQLFDRTLQEEKDTDRILSELAESSVNVRAEAQMTR